MNAEGNRKFETPEERVARVPHVSPECDDDGCWCPDDAFWNRMLGDDDPCAPGKDWGAAAFTEGSIDLRIPPAKGGAR